MCGLYGFVYYGKKELKGAEKLLENLAWEAAVRGTDATGYAFVHKGKVQVDKAPKPAHDMKYLLPKGVHTVMGHTRATTQGSAQNNYNNHPFKGIQGKLEFALAHNGVLDNEFEIRDEFNIKSNKIQTDSYVACQLMEKMKDFSMDSLRTVGETVEGMFTFTYMDSKENLYIIKNDSPLTLLHFPALQLYVYGSTDEIVFNAVANFNKTKNELIDMIIHEDYTIENIPVGVGDILKISPDGKIKRSEFKPKERVWNSQLYSVAGGWWDYEDEDAEWYKRLLLQDAEEMGITEKEFEALTQRFSLTDLEDYIYTGKILEIIATLYI